MNGLKLKNIKRNIHYHIVMVGLGANGSHVFRSMLQDMATYISSSYGKQSFEIIIADADMVEQKNLNNQLFDNEDVGEYKVRALGERYGEHYNFSIKAIPQYITDIETFKTLFTVDKGSTYKTIPILIGTVDNNRTRQLMDEFFHCDHLDELVYIDAGVEGVTIIPDKQPYHYTEDEKEMINGSGFSGQVVVGYKSNHQVWLPPVGRVFEDILVDEKTAFPGQSCGEAILNNPQRCATNKFASQIVNNVINNILHTQTIYAHVLNFNAQLSGVTPTYISKAILKEYEMEKERV